MHGCVEELLLVHVDKSLSIFLLKAIGHVLSDEVLVVIVQGEVKCYQRANSIDI